jgi:hypothetical protein
LQLRYQTFNLFSGLFDRVWRRRLGLCAVNEQGAARKSVYPSGNGQGGAKQRRCSQQPNRSLRCLTNRACARSVAAHSNNTPEEITSCSRRKWIAAIASIRDLSNGNPETVALHRPHRGSVAVGASQSHRMQSSGLTCVFYDTIIVFELQQLIWIKVLWAYPARSEANHRSIRCSLLVPSCRLGRQDSAAFTSPNRDARQKCARLL